jgi:hypothetical protein
MRYLLFGFLLAVVILTGFFGSYAASRNGANGIKTPSATADSKSTLPNVTASRPAAAVERLEPKTGMAAVVHRFPLTAADVKENLESAALAVTDNGDIHLAWASKVDAEQLQVFLTSSDDQGKLFSTPRVVAKSAIHRVSAQMRGKAISRELRILPRLVASGNTLVLGWVEAVANNTAVTYFVSTSSDGGKTFSDPIVASHDPAARPTFTSLALGPSGEIATSWLDNRHGVQLPAAAVRSTDKSEFGTDSIAYVSEGGKGVCPCCPTDIAIAADGTMYLAFRNQKDGFRDMWISRLKPGQSEFDPPKPVVSPRWTFDGCPHDAPSLAVTADQLQIAWMDASSGQPRVHLAHGSLEAEQFEIREVDLASKYSQGHPSLAIDDQQTIHLVWDEGHGTAVETKKVGASDSTSEDHGNQSSHDHRTGAESQPAEGESERIIRYATFTASGEPIAAAAAIAPRDYAFQSRPAVAVDRQGNVYSAWVELSGSGKSIAVARLKTASSKLVNN